MIGSKISRRYAKALLSIGQEDGQYEAYGHNLKEFADLCLENDEFFRVLCNQLFSLEDRKAILDSVLKDAGFPTVVNNFLRLLVDKERIGAIQEITTFYRNLTDELSDIKRAQVITARPLKKNAMDRLEQALAGMTKKNVKMNVSEDPELIGGLVVRIGDVVLDGSVKAQLDGLKESLTRGEYS